MTSSLRGMLMLRPGSGASAQVSSVALATNGDVLIGGNFTSVNGQSRNAVARLNSDGSLDNTFLPGQGPGGVANSVAIDPSGSIYVGGRFSDWNGITRNSLVRLRNDGSLDLTWPNVSFSDWVSLIQAQQNGQLLVLGGFRAVNGVSRRGLARLNTDGSLDTNFNPAAGVTDGSIYAVLVQPDGSVIISGDFTTNSPVARQCIARVSQSGVLDPTFNAGYIAGGLGAGQRAVSAVARQADGKLILLGGFFSINGYSRLGVARLNTNGTVDTTFVFPSGFDVSWAPSPSQITVLSSGKVLLAASYPNDNFLVQLNSDGSLDSTFSARANGSVYAFAIQPDGKLVVGGAFTSIGGTNINCIARLNGTSTDAPKVQFLGINRYAGMFLSGIVSNTHRVEWTTNLNTPSLWTPLFNVRLETNPQFVLDTNPISGRQRYYRAVGLH